MRRPFRAVACLFLVLVLLPLHRLLAADLIQQAISEMSARNYAAACATMMRYADQTTYFVATGSDNMRALARGVPPERYLASARAAAKAGDHQAACAYDLLAAAAYKTPAYHGDVEYAQQHVSDAIHAAKAEQAGANPAPAQSGTPGYADYQPAAPAAPAPAPAAVPPARLAVAPPAPAPAPVAAPAPAAPAPGAAGPVPAACQADWSHSGPLSQACAEAAFQQAQAEYQAGNCSAAVPDYKLARSAAQNAGTIVNMTLRTNDGLNACQARLNPQAQPQPIAYGPEGVVPNGSYTCYSYAGVVAAGPIRTVVALAQPVGAVWIYSNQSYANGSYNYLGHYSMKSSRIVASDGPFARNNVVAYYVPDGLYHRKTIVMGYADGKGGTTGNSACTYNGK